jgi:hydrogenase nickel incorporation protein HypA/HybF
MHEYSIASSLLRLAEEHAQKQAATRVASLEICIGELSGVEVPLLETAWSLVRERSVCADAELRVRRQAAVWECPRCGEAVARGLALRCNGCDVPARLARGGELLLERIEMEVGDV